MEQATVGGNLRRIPWRWLVYVSVGLLLCGWLLSTPGGLLGKADAIGYAVCHRIDSRSFHLGDRQLPLCARCSGMYLGVLSGLILQALVRPRRSGVPHWSSIVFSVLFVLAFAIDGGNSYLHLFPNAPSLYQPHNWLRLLTGTGMGIAISIAIFPAFNQTVWANWDARPAIDKPLVFIWIVLLAAGVDLLVLTQASVILFPLALISAAGILVLLTMIYTMVLVMIFRKENAYLRLNQMLTPLVSATGIALLQIALLDVARYLLTHTWQGFHLG